MKQCPSCKKTYDNTWGVCLHCEVPLKDVGDNVSEEREGPREQERPNFDMSSVQYTQINVDNFIGKQIKRCNRNLLIVNVALILTIAWAFFTNCFYGLGIWFGLIITAISILAIANIIKAMRRNSNSAIHPINKELSRFGPVQKVVESINKEIKEDKNNLSLDNSIITSSWLLRPSFFAMNIFLLGELVWIHQRITTNSTYGIETGKDYAVAIYNRHGKHLEFKSREHNANSIMGVISSRAPWVIAGYSDELMKLWESNRNAFITLVDGRRTQPTA